MRFHSMSMWPDCDGEVWLGAYGLKDRLGSIDSARVNSSERAVRRRGLSDRRSSTSCHLTRLIPESL